MLAMILLVALKIMQLKFGLKMNQCMQQMYLIQTKRLSEYCKTLSEGGTKLRKIPYKKQALVWATWMLTRLAGVVGNLTVIRIYQNQD